MTRPWVDRTGRFSPLRAGALALVLCPALLIAWEGLTEGLGERPLEALTQATGLWAVRLLILTLFVTPLRRVLDRPRLVAVRRILGLATLAYALVHLGFYIADKNGHLLLVATEIVSRFYLAVGAIALIGLGVLGFTSTDRAIRELGAVRWGRLHALVYGIAVLGLLHFFLHAKADVSEPVMTAGLFLLAMLVRLAHRLRLPLSVPTLAALAVVAALATAAGEAAWYGLTTGVDWRKVVAANLSFALTIRPAWWVLAAGLALVALRAGKPATSRAGDAVTGRQAGDRRWAILPPRALLAPAALFAVSRLAIRQPDGRRRG